MLSPRGCRRTKVKGNFEIDEDLVLSPMGGGGRWTKVVVRFTNGQDNSHARANLRRYRFEEGLLNHDVQQ